ncbi:NAD-dependent epimerase/dehydratase family protein [Lachnospiraceae bacterium JLR.KK008]
MKIVVTGSTGFLGSHLMPILHDTYGKENVKGLSSRDYDLMDFSQARQMFEDLQPEVLIHLAAYSGGIGANRKYPGDFYFINTILTANCFELAARYGVKKMIYPMGGCSYPSTASSPIGEEQMWQGYPQRESAGYSSAKKMGIVASHSYRTQYGLNSVVLIPGNMYGPFDNFRNEESHVVPGMLRRYFEAKRDKIPKVTMWGTGAPVRDFVYAGDVAALIPWFIENFNETGPVNLSSGTTTSMKELAEIIREMTGYEGEIEWDTDKPDGQMIKIFDVAKLKSLGLSCPTPLKEGLRLTAQWLEKNYDTKGDRIRL